MIANNREEGGRLVREAWIKWALTTHFPKPTWLVSWEDLPEPDREADRCIWDAISAPYSEAMQKLIDENRYLKRRVEVLLADE